MTRDIVRKILVADPNVRLEIKDIMQHKFFEGVDWQQVSKKLSTPPYIPPEINPQRQNQLNIEENPNCPTTATTSLPHNSYGNPNAPAKTKNGSGTSQNSSPNVRRANPNKILGDFHLTKLN